MKLIIAGSRNLQCSQVLPFLDYCVALNGITGVTAVVSGSARGPDRWGELWALHHSIDLIRYPAEWKKYGRYAGHIRNKRMAEVGDELLVLWDGISAGTFNMIQQMKILKKPTHIVLCSSDIELSPV